MTYKALAGRLRKVSDLQLFLIALIRDSGVPQVELASRAGFSQKHVSEMMNGWQEGSIDAWDRLLTAAGVTVGKSS